jgi:hypothetical protein
MVLYPFLSCFIVVTYKGNSSSSWSHMPIPDAWWNRTGTSGSPWYGTNGTSIFELYGPNQDYPLFNDLEASACKALQLIAFDSIGSTAGSICHA